MKLLIKQKIIIYLTLISVVSFAQTSDSTLLKKERSTEIGLRILDPIFLLSKSNRINYFRYYPIDISVKFRYGKSYLRINNRFHPYKVYTSNGKESYLNYFNFLSAGYERRTKPNRFQFLYGGELGYYLNVYRRINYDLPLYQNGYFVSPVIGGVYNINDHFSIQSELSFGWGIIETDYHYYPDNYPTYSFTFFYGRNFSMYLFYKF